MVSRWTTIGVATGLSLNLGLRYEYFAPWQEKYGHIANLEIAPSFSAVAPCCPDRRPYGVTYPAALINPDRNNFAPRIALAWKPWPKGKILIRAGYGWYYNPSQYNQFMSRRSRRSLRSRSRTPSPPARAYPLTLATGLIAVPSGKTITNTYAVALDYRDMYAQTWNVGIQRDLAQARW